MLLALGCDPSPSAEAPWFFAVEPGSQMPGQALHWTLAGARRVKPLPTNGGVTYDAVYTGVRLTVENRPHAVAYRFDIAPGGEAKSIRMRYEGADEVSVEGGGRALRVRTGSRTLREDGLFCYQDIAGSRHEVPCRYRMATARDGTSEVAFDISSYDPSRQLVVDPVIGWSSYLGGNSYDAVHAVAIDGSGNVYLTGRTDSDDFPSSGGFDTSIGGLIDAFVTKVNADGSTLAWSSYLGGSDDDEGTGIAVDGSGNVYVSGYTTSWA